MLEKFRTIAKAISSAPRNEVMEEKDELGEAVDQKMELLREYAINRGNRGTYWRLDGYDFNGADEVVVRIWFGNKNTFVKDETIFSITISAKKLTKMENLQEILSYLVDERDAAVHKKLH